MSTASRVAVDHAADLVEVGVDGGVELGEPRLQPRAQAFAQFRCAGAGGIRRRRRSRMLPESGGVEEPGSRLAGDRCVRRLLKPGEVSRRVEHAEHHDRDERAQQQEQDKCGREGLP